MTAAYPDGDFNGYTIQTRNRGAVNLAEHKASDGLFVYDSKNVKDLQIGDYVKVNGTISEYYGLTELNASSVTKLSDKVEAPKASTMAFPKTDTERESLESMLIAPQGDYTVSDVYNTNKYGEIGLAASNKPFLNPTVKGLKGDAETGAAYQAELDRIEAEGVYLDDGSSRNFLDTKYPDNADTPLPYLSNDQPVRVGEKVTFTKPVVLDYRNSAWRFQPTERLTGDNADAQPVTFTSTRTDTPDLAAVGGDIRLATFNVLNYFSTTADKTGCSTSNAYTDRDGNPVTAKNCDVRGAWDKANMERQRAKIVKAINNLGADVVSLEEIENSAKAASSVPASFKGERRDYALATLVDALNEQAGEGTWAYVPTPADRPRPRRGGRDPHRVHLQAHQGRDRRRNPNPHRLRRVQRQERLRARPPARRPGVQDQGRRRLRRVPRRRQPLQVQGLGEQRAQPGSRRRLRQRRLHPSGASRRAARVHR